MDKSLLPAFLMLPLTLCGPAAAATVEVAREAEPTVADGTPRLQAWTSAPSDGAPYGIKLRAAGGAITQATLAGPVAAGEIDVGTLGDGSPAVAAVRCDPDCDVVVYDPATGAERALPAGVNTGAQEGAPSLHRGRLAFARTAGGRARVYVVRLTGGKPAVQRGLRGRKLLGVTATELSSRGLLVLGLFPAEFRDQRLYRVAAGRARQLDRAFSGGANAAHMTKPSVSGRHVYYARTNNGSGTGNRFFRLDLRSGRRVEALGNPRIASAAWLGAARGFLVTESAFDLCPGATPDEPNAGACPVYETGRLSWRKARPPRRS